MRLDFVEIFVLGLGLVLDRMAAQVALGQEIVRALLVAAGVAEPANLPEPSLLHPSSKPY